MDKFLSFLRSEFQKISARSMPRLSVLVILMAGVGAILISRPYLNEAFWYNEMAGEAAAMVILWGRFSYRVGTVLLILGASLFAINTTVQRIIISAVLAIMPLMQIPPVLSWWAYHGALLRKVVQEHEIPEAALKGAFKAHWGYSIPHIVLMMIALLSIYVLNRSQPRLEGTRK